MGDLSLLLEELASCQLLCLRNSCRWLESMTVTPLLRDPLELLETSPKLPTLPSRRFTATLPLTSGKRPCSPSLHIRNSRTSWQRTTKLPQSRSRKPARIDDCTVVCAKCESGNISWPQIAKKKKKKKKKNPLGFFLFFKKKKKKKKKS